jgi:hypothetical protein
MSIGQAYSDVLSFYEQKALESACDWLIDHAFDELKYIEKPQDVADTIVGGYLPERYLYKYTPLFFKQFAVCIITVTWKLAQPEPMPLASLAEELAAWIIVYEAKRILQDQLEEASNEDNLDAFIDAFFEDIDVEFLFNGAFDGIDEIETGKTMGIASLAFDNWFKPFSDEPDQIVHPYVV